MADDQMIVELVPALRSFARTLYRNEVDADDLVQETLSRALASIDQFEQGTRLKSWLFTIMRNTFLTKIRLYNREGPGLEDCASLQGVSPPSQEWSQTLRDTQAAIERLPKQQREVLVLVAILGTEYHEAAEICGCPIGTIKSRLARARSVCFAIFNILTALRRLKPDPYAVTSNSHQRSLPPVGVRNEGQASRSCSLRPHEEH